MGLSDAKKWIGPNPNHKVPDITLHDPANRHVRVITIGAGVSGLMLAYNMQTECENVTNAIYERNPTLGGLGEPGLKTDIRGMWIRSGACNYFSC